MKKEISLLILVAVLLVAVKYSFMTGDVIKEVSDKGMEFHFCPRDDCEGVLINLIKDAKTIHCALYDLDLENIVAALKNFKGEKKIFMDDRNYLNLGFTKADNKQKIMHNKFCVFDGDVVLTGSLNPTFHGVYKNNNNMVVIHSRYLAKNYEDEFNELWSGAETKTKYPVMYLDGIKTENYFCPEDNCEKKIIDALIGANKSILFMTFSFTSDAIGDTLLRKKDEVEIKGIFEKSQISKWSEFATFKLNNMDVKLDSNKYNMHHKVFIIDEKTVITGSFNPTKSANTKNDENILIIHDKNIADMYLKEFNLIWAGQV